MKINLQIGFHVQSTNEQFIGTDLVAIITIIIINPHIATDPHRKSKQIKDSVCLAVLQHGLSG